MTLYEKIIAVYPELANNDPRENTFGSVILLKNDSDGRGDYIAKWEHPSLSEPTQDQLDAVEETE